MQRQLPAPRLNFFLRSFAIQVVLKLDMLLSSADQAQYERGAAAIYNSTLLLLAQRKTYIMTGHEPTVLVSHAATSGVSASGVVRALRTHRK